VLKGGETILFHAAAGGVGLIACQMARALGVNMIGYRGLGCQWRSSRQRPTAAAHTIVYTREDFVARTKEITGGKGVPVVYDSIGKDTFPKSLDCLATARIVRELRRGVRTHRRVQIGLAGRRRVRCT
jgi:NADPH2:quinone reductase